MGFVSWFALVIKPNIATAAPRFKPAGVAVRVSHRGAERLSAIVRRALCSAAWLALPSPAFAADPPALANVLIGGRFTHTVAPGDTLGRIGARHAVAPAQLARDNGLKADARLKPGTALTVDNLHIVPRSLAEGILINIPQRMLFLFEDGRLASAHPVALGRPDWPTPAGGFEVITRQMDKPWIVPPSIQAEMRREGKPVLTRVEPGPDNPLGRHWIGLSIPGYGIHGTIAPSSIYGLRSHGCIRLHPDDAAALFERVAVGTPGELIYTPALLARLEDGRIFAEVHRDAYREGVDAAAELHALAAAAGLEDMIDGELLAEVVRRRDGLAREVTHRSSPQAEHQGGPKP
ncbi:MAG: L,D-transpeptidase family protein [Betaproteobacteria bacterium]|nr:L,D-transpeptidase family protein [Betaproteobacteria bacterium]